MLELLRLAARYAVLKHDDDRVFLLGAVGVRSDGRLVHAQNSSVLDTLKRAEWNAYKRFPESHAEIRLTKKLGFGATMYVARVKRANHNLAMARPCECCRNIIKAFRVKKVYYTISDNEWGVWDPIKDCDTYYLKG
jgi:tRNA(Arg) A34 adenosine deaminase TadA